jgi:hypothetical protein
MKETIHLGNIFPSASAMLSWARVKHARDRTVTTSAHKKFNYCYGLVLKAPKANH